MIYLTLKMMRIGLLAKFYFLIVVAAGIKLYDSTIVQTTKPRLLHPGFEALSSELPTQLLSYR